MKILAIDTATEACSVALLCGDKVLEKHVIAPQQHTKLILPMIEGLLLEAKLELSDLNALAFGRGPGSFTGLRIATSVIQALAFGANLPVIPISTLQALAQAGKRLYQATAVCAAMDARMQEIYWSCYQLTENGVMEACSEEKVSLPEKIDLPEGIGWLGIGSGWENPQLLEQYKGKVSAIYPSHYPLAEDMLKLAKFYYEQGQMVSAEEALPVYLRDDVVKAKN